MTSTQKYAAALVLLCSLLLPACASLQSAGVAEYTVRPIVIGEQTLCCEITVRNGKEYASLKASIRKTGNDYSVDLEEQAVQAFAGQGKAAAAVATIAKSTATLGAAIVGGPAIGAGLQAVLP